MPSPRRGCLLAPARKAHVCLIGYDPFKTSANDRWGTMLTTRRPAPPPSCPWRTMVARPINAPNTRTLLVTSLVRPLLWRNGWIRHLRLHPGGTGRAFKALPYFRTNHTRPLAPAITTEARFAGRPWDSPWWKKVSSMDSHHLLVDGYTYTLQVGFRICFSSLFYWLGATFFSR
jgi:hypothetical protein